jgi:SH3-like domain-containing protein
LGGHHVNEGILAGSSVRGCCRVLAWHVNGERRAILRRYGARPFRRYNLATGSGFLAVRTRPNSSSRMIGQLFNGDHTEIFDRRGNWYQVEIGGTTGWANARWLRNDCGY